MRRNPAQLEAQVLELLAGGETLTAIAQQLSVSPQAISDRVASLRRATGSRTTFQLCYWAGQRMGRKDLLDAQRRTDQDAPSVDRAPRL